MACRGGGIVTTDFSELIPELPSWNDGGGIDAESWIGCVGNYQLAVGYTLIFWPRFVRFDDYVLREGFSIESLRGFERQSGSTRASVEWVMTTNISQTSIATKRRYLKRSSATLVGYSPRFIG
jgi:hypothetical protein